ncbi:MAG: hypothetical protein S0880_19060 [Actinomycetota bacterium]|nr:hypothetical protein [Actinomycetota bacterium]
MFGRSKKKKRAKDAQAASREVADEARTRLAELEATAERSLARMEEGGRRSRRKARRTRRKLNRAVRKAEARTRKEQVKFDRRAKKAASDVEDLVGKVSSDR